MSFVLQITIGGQVRKCERSIPRADFTIEDRGALVRSRKEMFSDTLADFLRRSSSRPVAEIVLLPRGRDGSAEDQTSECKHT